MADQKPRAKSSLLQLCQTNSAALHGLDTFVSCMRSVSRHETPLARSDRPDLRNWPDEPAPKESRGRAYPLLHRAQHGSVLGTGGIHRPHARKTGNSMTEGGTRPCREYSWRSRIRNSRLEIWPQVFQTGGPRPTISVEPGHEHERLRLLLRRTRRTDRGPTMGGAAAAQR